MAQTQDNQYTPLFAIRGRNGEDPPFLVPDTQAIEALNVDWFRSSLGRKRGGSANVTLTGGTAPVTGILSAGVFHPTASPAADELWLGDDVTSSHLMHRIAGGTAMADVLFTGDFPTTRAQDVQMVSFNRKLWFVYDSAVNRLHCYDPSDGLGYIRRVGFATPATVTTALAGGAVTDSRKYRIAWTTQVSGVTIRRSLLSVATGVVSPAAQQVTVTRSTAASETETHWELYAYSDDDNYGIGYLIATTAIGTTTAVDNNATLSTVLFPTTAPAEGAYTPPPSAKYIVADDARLVMGGAWETTAGDSLTPKDNAVWWTQTLRDASAVGNDERISNTDEVKGYDFIEEAVTGISSPVQGSFRVFSLESQWKFVATGLDDAPYKRFRVTGGKGCIRHQTIVVAQDENGDPATYWLCLEGPVRQSSAGQQMMDHDIRDIWDTVNLDASGVVAHGVYHKALRQIWWWVATGSSTTPDTRIVFDTRLGRVSEIVGGVTHGWSKFTGEGSKAHCSVMFSETIAASMSRSQKPYFGYTGAVQLWRGDTSATDDAGTAFQAYIESKPLVPWGLGKLGGTALPLFLVAKAQSGVTIRCTTIVNEDATGMSYTSDLLLTPTGTETRIFRKFEDASISAANCFRIRLGDAAAVANTWNLDALMCPLVQQGEL